MPRLRSWVQTASQNLAPSFSEIHIPSSSFFPSKVTPSAKYTALLSKRWFSFTLITKQSIYRMGYSASRGRFCRLLNLFHHRLGDIGDECRGDLDPIPLQQLSPGQARVEKPWAYIHRIFSWQAC